MEFRAQVDADKLPGPIQEAFFNLIRSFWENGTLDGQIKEMIRMRSAFLVDCNK